MLVDSPEICGTDFEPQLVEKLVDPLVPCENPVIAQESARSEGYSLAIQGRRVLRIRSHGSIGPGRILNNGFDSGILTFLH